METILRTNQKGTVKLMRESFKEDKAYATFNTGDPIYRVYVENKLLFQTKSLKEGYVYFLSCDKESYVQEMVPEGQVLIIYNIRSYKKGKVLGVFSKYMAAAFVIYRNIELFMKKKGDKEKAQLEVLDTFLRQIPLPKDNAVPYLKVDIAELNQLYLRTF